MKHWIIVLCACIFCQALVVALPFDAVAVVAFWNVENLFDAVDDPANEGDDGFTPDGWMRWTEARYQLKLRHLAEVIAKIQPDIIGLVEIENRQVLLDLMRILKKRQGYDMPHIVHRDSDEKRGIDVAILSKHLPIGKTWLKPVNKQREILAVDFLVHARPLKVVVNHWKSQLGKKSDSDEIRRKEAQALRVYLDGQMVADPTLAILVGGDFNDDPTSTILLDNAGLVLDEQKVRADGTGRLLFNLAGTLSERERATFYYALQNKWNTFDMISVTRNLLPNVTLVSPWCVRAGSYRVFRLPQQYCAKTGVPLPFRRVRNLEVGDVFVKGYSDHFPVRVELMLRTNDLLHGTYYQAL